MTVHITIGHGDERRTRTFKTRRTFIDTTGMRSVYWNEGALHCFAEHGISYHIGGGSTVGIKGH